MNQELTQRIIGAIVVTALAAIFIPMLFEDPVDNSGQVVSELVIPEESAITVDDTVSKLPRDATDIANWPDETEETPNNSEADMEGGLPAMNDQELVGDAMDSETVGEEPSDTADSAIDRQDRLPSPATATLDTGEVKAVKKPIPKNTPKAPEIKPQIKPPPTTTTIKKPQAIIPKSAPKPAATTASEKQAKPAKTSGNLSRWYIQVGSFSKKDNAISLSDTLRKQGMPVLLETIQTSKGARYRVRVGPELDKGRAATMKGKLDQQHISNILLSE